MKIRLITLLMLSQIAVFGQQLQLPKIFSSGMVLQQKTEAPIWGKAQPNSAVSVTASWGKVSSTTSNEKGLWRLLIKTPKAGGPFTITITSGNQTETLKDVYSGEVWVCSGQSNMEMPLAGWPPADTIRNAALEIQKATQPNLHYITVERAYSISRNDDIKGTWKQCAPENAATISATAYYFGRKLQETLKIPVGLIITTWGGTPAEAWVDPAMLSNDPDFGKIVSHFPNMVSETESYNSWLNNHTKKSVSANLHESMRWKNLDFQDSYCSASATDDSKWPTMPLPQSMEKTMGDFDGVVWFRKHISVPSEMLNTPVELSLSMIDDMDRVYVNGTLVGATEELGAWQVKRVYSIPAGLLKDGDNTISVRVIDNTGGGGIWGDAANMYLKAGSQSLPIAGEWKYLPVAEYTNEMFYEFDAKTQEYNNRPKMNVKIGASSPGVLFNAMVAPISSYKIKGAIWYQGESNVGRAQQYTSLFPMLINSWRANWGQGNFPFYFTQIAPYSYSGVNNNESAYIRDAQRRSLTTENTGMAVTLDIGSIQSIHPSNKIDVGDRLARFALANQYGIKVAKSGPLFKNAVFNGGKAVITFGYSKGLKITGNSSDEFELAGNDGVFYPASAKVVKETVEVTSDKVAAPAMVRYAFRNGSKAILFNADGLPASGFTTESTLK